MSVHAEFDFPSFSSELSLSRTSVDSIEIPTDLQVCCHAPAARPIPVSGSYRISLWFSHLLRFIVGELSARAFRAPVLDFPMFLGRARRVAVAAATPRALGA